MKRFGFVIGFVVTALCIGSLNAQASPTQGSTRAFVEFEDLQPPEILNPNNPDQVLTPPPGSEDGDVNTATGELTLDFVPNLYFGKNEISGNTDGRYKATSTTNTPGPFIQVTDRRIDPGQWTVSVKAEQFKLDTANTLPQAYITFEKGTIRSRAAQQSDTTIEGPFLRFNESDGITKVMTDNEYVSLLSAKKGQAPFTWLVHWLDSGAGVYLHVPAATMQVGKHTSVLTWTLTPDLATPASGN